MAVFNRAQQLQIAQVPANNAVSAISASVAISASIADIAQTASYALTASYVINSGSGGTTTGSFTGSFTGSLLGTASYALTASYAMNGGGSIDTSSLVTTSSFNAFTSSIQGQVTSLTNATSSYVLNSSTSSFITNSQTSSFVTNAQTSSFAQNSQTGSFVQNSQTSSMSVLSASYAYTTDHLNPILVTAPTTLYPILSTDVGGNKVPYIDGDLSFNPTTNVLYTSASYALTASLAPDYVLNNKTGSFTTTSSFNSFTSSINGVTGSFLTTGSNNTSQAISGSLIINQNLTVLGSSSITYVTSSQLNIGTNIITVNTATPAVRFGGLAVYDSGSTGTGLTGSILWDSQNNVWIYSNPSGSSYDGAMILVGPRNSTGLGNEIGINSGYAAIGNGSHHMTSSAIYNSGSLIRLETNTQITGSLITLNADGNINTSASILSNRYSIDTIKWGDYYLQDSTNVPSVDWNNYQLIDNSGGAIVKINWGNGTLRDSGNVPSLDWENKELVLGSAVTVKWGQYILYDPINGYDSLDWSIRKMRSSTNGYTAIDWDNRILYDNQTGNEVNTVLTWGDSTTSNGVRLYGTSSYALTASFIITAQTASYILNAISSSFASTASFINTLNQNVIITGSLTVGATTAGSSENTLILGPRDNGSEGGQLMLSPPGGTYTSASMIDNYQNKLRFLRGTTASSDAYKMQIDMHTGQVQIPNYNSATALTGSPVTSLRADNNGYMLTGLIGYAPQLDLFSALGSTTKADPVFAQGGLLGGTGVALVDGTGIGVAIHVPYQMTVTGIRWWRTGTSGVYTADNYNGVALYSYSGGNLTLVASSSNTPNIWSSSYAAATSIYVTRSFVSTYNAAPGIYFAVGVYNQSAQTTAPIIGSGPQAIFNINNVSYDYTNGARHFFTTGISSSLPSSIVISSTSPTLNQAYFALY